MNCKCPPIVELASSPLVSGRTVSSDVGTCTVNAAGNQLKPPPSLLSADQPTVTKDTSLSLHYSVARHICVMEETLRHTTTYSIKTVRHMENK